MIITAIIARRGFDLRINEWDFASNERVLVCLRLLWGQSWLPAWQWGWYWEQHGNDVTFTYRRYRKQERSGWRLRSPLQRF